MLPKYLIYGASSSVGLFALQLAKLMGYRPIAICSPHNFDLVKSYGAEVTIDYHDGSRASKEIKQVSGGGVELGLDTISEGQSFKICLDGFSEKGGQLNTILGPSEEAKNYRSNIKVIDTLMYTLFGRVCITTTCMFRLMLTTGDYRTSNWVQGLSLQIRMIVLSGWRSIREPQSLLRSTG